jgi:hypothetical protein
MDTLREDSLCFYPHYQLMSLHVSEKERRFDKMLLVKLKHLLYPRYFWAPSPSHERTLVASPCPSATIY